MTRYLYLVVFALGLLAGKFLVAADCGTRGHFNVGGQTFYCEVSE